MGRRAAFLGAGYNVLLLSVASLLTDFGSEMIMPILPLFIVSLGGSGIAVGIIAGLGDSLSSLLKVFSGYWSDKTGKRKPFVLAGYFSSATAKLFFPLSTHWLHLVLLRPIERLGKGLRTAPRDALIADSLKAGFMGRAFGFHRAMDTAGAVLGSLAAFLLVWSLGWGFRPVLFTAALVSFAALVPLIWVREISRESRGEATLKVSLKGLPWKLKLFILAATVFTLGEFSYMFFILRAGEILALKGMEHTATPILLYVFFNIFYAGFAFPAGMLADRFGRLKIIFFGYLLFTFTCLGFYAIASPPLYVLLFIAYGLTYALIEGNVRAYVAELSPENVRGTALGAFHTSVGLAALPSNLIAGVLWQLVNPQTVFLYGVALSLAALCLLLFLTLSSKP